MTKNFNQAFAKLVENFPPTPINAAPTGPAPNSTQTPQTSAAPGQAMQQKPGMVQPSIDLNNPQHAQSFYAALAKETDPNKVAQMMQLVALKK